MIWYKRRPETRLKPRNLTGHLINVAHRLEDRRDLCYVWIPKDGITPTQRASLETTLRESFDRALDGDPKALHLVLDDVKDIAVLTRDEVMGLVEPWTRARGKT